MTINMKIWDKEYELKVVFDVFEGEEVLESQNDALTQFVENSESLLSDPNEVKQYCATLNSEIPETQSVHDYVRPEMLYVVRDSEKRTVVLCCDYEFDVEHGIAIVFEDERFVKVTDQSEIV